MKFEAKNETRGGIMALKPFLNGYTLIYFCIRRSGRVLDLRLKGGWFETDRRLAEKELTRLSVCAGSPEPLPVAIVQKLSQFTILYICQQRRLG